MYFLSYIPLCFEYIYIYIYMHYMLLSYQRTSVCNLQPYDYDYHDVFKVTYKPYGAGWLYCGIILLYVTLSHVTIIKILLCYVMLCYVIICYVMLCYVMLCYVMYQVLCTLKYRRRSLYSFLLCYGGIVVIVEFYWQHGPIKYQCHFTCT